MDSYVDHNQTQSQQKKWDWPHSIHDSIQSNINHQPNPICRSRWQGFSLVVLVSWGNRDLHKPRTCCCCSYIFKYNLNLETLLENKWSGWQKQPKRNYQSFLIKIWHKNNRKVLLLEWNCQYSFPFPLVHSSLSSSIISIYKNKNIQLKINLINKILFFVISHFGLSFAWWGGLMLFYHLFFITCEMQNIYPVNNILLNNFFEQTQTQITVTLSLCFSLSSVV